jgi:hypothetical protein
VHVVIADRPSGAVNNRVPGAVMIYEIRRINVWSVMKVAFVIFAILGLVVGIFYAIFFAFMGQVMELATPGEFDSMTGLFSGVMGIFAAFFLAILYAVMGSVMTAVFAGIYNLLARGLGGVELQLEPKSQPASPPPAPPLRTESHWHGSEDPNPHRSFTDG